MDLIVIRITAYGGNYMIQWNLSIYNGHFGTRYFWPFLLQYRGLPLSGVKNALVTPVGTKILSLLYRGFFLIRRVC